MKVKRLLIASTATLMFLLPWGAAQAFECPKHLAAAQAAIDRVRGELRSMEMPKIEEFLILKLLDDAKWLLANAFRKHENPEASYDHARAIVLANTARAHAESADTIHLHFMKQQQ